MQSPAYDGYQEAIAALIGFEEAEARGFAASTTSRIQQAEWAGDILLGFGFLIVLGTGWMVIRMLRTLRRDKRNLQTLLSEHERAERERQEGEARYRMLLDHSSDAVLILCDDRIVLVNPAALVLLGAEALEQLIGRRPSEIVHPEEQSEVTRRTNEIADGRQPPTTARRLLRLDGSIVEAESTVIAFLYERRPALQVILRDATERRARERELREADEKYRSIFNNAQEGIFQNTPEGVFLAVNPALARMLGFESPGELIRERNDLEAQSYAEPGQRQEFKRRLEREGFINNYEYRVKRKDGNTIWVSENVRVVRAEAGQASYYEGSVQDITERKRAEEQLRRSVERFQSFTEATSQIVWQTDPEGRVVEDVPSWRAYTGQSLEEIIGFGWSDALHPDDLERTLSHWTECKKNQSNYEIEYRMRGADGIYRDFSVRGVSVLDADGATREWVGINADITERKRASARIAQQAALLDLAHDAIMVRDLEGHILFWSKGAERLYGYTSEEAIGQKARELIYGANSEHYEKANAATMVRGEWLGEMEHLVKNGSGVTVDARWTLVRDELGNPKSVLSFSNDITEKKKIEEHFLRAQRMESIGTLASGVAHDLNNVLLPIMMAAPILREDSNRAEREKFLDIVEASAQRGADIVKQVLTFARGADGDRLLLQPIYLLQEVAKIAAQTFPKSIVLRTRFEENIRSLGADPTQLHQVLLNLCINARDAMPDGGELSLSVENFDVDLQYASMIPGATIGPHVILQVTDTGSGIPPEVQPKIFDPFFTTKDIGHGTGLGLSTVAGIVKSHGGFLQLESEPGRTRFKIFLPAAETGADSASLEAEASVPRGQGQTILVVDDEVSIRQLAGIVLESHGYNVLLAEDGPTALAVFAQQPGLIDVVVTDLAMPMMDGVLLVRTLRRIAPSVKIIISTGRADDAKSAELAALGVDDRLTKPYTTRTFLLKLDQVLQSGLEDAA